MDRPSSTDDEVKYDKSVWIRPDRVLDDDSYWTAWRKFRVGRTEQPYRDHWFAAMNSEPDSQRIIDDYSIHVAKLRLKGEL